MTSKPFDFEAARAELRGKIATNDAALTTVRDRLGALALDVTLGNAQQSELDAATSEQARLQATADALTGALAEVDKREAAHKVAEAEQQRQADAKRLAELRGACDTAGAKVVDLASRLADALAEGQRAAREGENICRKLGVSDGAMRNWPWQAGSVANGLLHRANSNFSHGGYVRPGELEAAASALAGQQ
jgi:chromosome segregation ATPase